MKSIFSKLVYFIVMILLIKEGAAAAMKKNTLNLPKTVDIWTRSDSARIIDSTNIFNYMNGAGELYLAYRFDHLEVYEYIADQQEKVVVEVYLMKTSNDAFGLFSLDWSGEPVNFTASSKSQLDSLIAPSTRALYHGGLLLLCSGNIFARIMAYQETVESKEAVLNLGKAIAKNKNISVEPEILKILPQSFNNEWILRNDRIAYLRSIMVLNHFIISVIKIFLI